MTPHQPEISKLMDKMFPGCLKLRPIRVSDFETFKAGWARDDVAELEFQNTMRELGNMFRGHSRALVALFRFLLLISPATQLLNTECLQNLQKHIQNLIYKYVA